MARLPQIRGALLEEVVLYLLRANGYAVVDSASGPPLSKGPSGLEIEGRGCRHQIDAIADYRFSPPFSNPQRLLVEAKCLNKRVGVEVVRNALGVLKDVSEFPTSVGRPSRFHYQYAVVSDTSFSSRAQRYAFAQDIYLLPLGNNQAIRPILQRIRGLTPADFDAAGPDITVHLPTLRETLRDRLADRNSEPSAYDGVVDSLVGEARQVGQALIAVALRAFPIFLVPERGVDVRSLQERTVVRIRWRGGAWFLDDQNDRRLFSFDLPAELFEQYAVEGELTRPAALELKEHALSELEATVFSGSLGRIVKFELDANWIEQVRARLQDTRNKQ